MSGATSSEHFVATTWVLIASLYETMPVSARHVSETATGALVSAVLPLLTEHGDLPPGVHVAGWAEIEQRFGKGTRARVLALARLRQVHELARRTGSLRKFYVFGSFVSAAAEPRDVDVVLIMGTSFRIEDCPWELRPLFSHVEAELRYGASVFWFREGALPDELLRAWQLKRDGTLRGILEVA